MWTAYIEEKNPAADLGAPCDPAALDRAAKQSGRPLPTVLVEVLREANGVSTDLGLGRIVWSIDRIIDRPCVSIEVVMVNNLSYRADDFQIESCPPELVLLFGDPGTGDPYLFINDGNDETVYEWARLDHFITPFALSFHDYIDLSV